MVVNERKVAEMAAFFLLKTKDRSMDYLKLMKLLYLSDRNSFRQHGFSISEDEMFSMEKGPVLSHTWNLMKGSCPYAPKGWSSLISPIEEFQVSLLDSGINVDGLLELSRSDEEIMDSVWKEFGHLNYKKLVDYTHNLPEWEDPGKSSHPITLDTLFKALDFSDTQAGELKKQIAEQRAIDKFFSKRQN